RSTDSSFWKEHSSTARSPWREASRSVWVRLSAASDTAVAPCVWLSVGCIRFSPRLSVAYFAMQLDGALALAAADFERHVPVPVDELVHRLEAEVDREREVLYKRLELAGADARCEVVPLLARLAVGLVVANPALDRVGDPLRREAQLQARPEFDLA